MALTTEVSPKIPETQEKKNHAEGGLTQVVENIQILTVLCKIIEENKDKIDRKNKARQLAEEVLEKLNPEQLADTLIDNNNNEVGQHLNDEGKTALKEELTRLLKSRLSPMLHPLTKLPGKDARIELMSRVIINNFQENTVDTESKDLKQKIETKIKNIASIALDISGLKPVNDFFGHEVGDQYLRNSATALEQAVQEFQKENPNLKINLFHDSGDEFSVFIEDMDGTEITKEKMSAFREMLRNKLKTCNSELIKYDALKEKQKAQTRHTLYEQLIGSSSVQTNDEERKKLKNLADSIKNASSLSEEQINSELTEEKYGKIKAELKKTFQKSAENLRLFAFLENTEWETNTSFGVCTLEDALRLGRGRVTKKPLESITQGHEGANALAKGLAALLFTTADILGLEAKKREMEHAKQSDNEFDKGFAILRERTPDARDNAAKLQEARQKIEELVDKLSTCETRLSQFTDP